jgi:DNA-binding transcriptional LysR family regulator
VGTAVLPFARAALEAVDGARLTVDQLAGLVHGQVRVGMVSGCALPALAQLLAEFHGRYPGVAIVLSEGGSDQMVSSLLDGQLDLALVGSAGAETPGIDVEVVVDEVLVAAVARDHALAARRTMAIRDLRGQPLVCLPRGTGVRTALDAACASAGFEPHIVFEASALPMVAELAGLGLGVAVLPTSTARAHQPALHVLQVGRRPMRSRLELAWSATEATNPAARVLIAHAREFMRGLSPVTTRPGSG